MTASSTVVIQNLAYLVGAIVLAIVIGLVVWLRHRPPRSVESNVESFHRGLRALAPDDHRPPARPAGLRIQPPQAEEPAATADDEEEEEEEEAEEAPLDLTGEPAGSEEAPPPVETGAAGDSDVAAPPGETEGAAEAEPDASAEVVDLPKQEADGAGSGEAAGDWAGAETG